MVSVEARPAGGSFHIFKFISAWPFAQIYKRFRKHLWLLCEYGTEARDNSYYLFAYLRQEQPQVDAVYAISKTGGISQRCVLLGKRWNMAAGGTGFTT